MPRLPSDAIKRVCIIGAGPSGLAAARYLLAEKHFTVVDIFEQRPSVGGVWNINTRNAQPTPIPSTDPFWDGCNVSALTLPTRATATGISDRYQSDPIYDDEAKQAESSGLHYDSPLYPTLETNIPHQIMAYYDHPFAETQRVLNFTRHSKFNRPSSISPPRMSSGSDSPASKEEPISSDSMHVPLFPPYTTVLSYLRQSSLPFLDNIRFSTKVVSAQPVCNNGVYSQADLPPTTKWTVTTCHLPTSEMKTAIYDALVVANGHYTSPYLPDMPGLKTWSRSYPDAVAHSRDFRTVDRYRDQKTVVIGGSASGRDIGQQISHVCQEPLIRVIRSGNPGDDRHCYKTISEFLPPDQYDHGIKFTGSDGNTHVETGITRVLFATGYLYSFPFFPSSLQETLIGRDGARIHEMYQHLLLRTNPTCAFMVLPLKVVPFPMADAQAAVLARLWSGRLDLPSNEDMEKWELDMVDAKGDGKSFHTMEYPEDVDYLNSLVEWASEADKKHGLEHDERGMEVSKWDDEVRWLRKMFPEMRKRYMAYGEKRREIASWEELGIDYAKCRGEQETRVDGTREDGVPGE